MPYKKGTKGIPSMTDLTRHVSFAKYFDSHPSLDLRRKEVRTHLRKLARRYDHVVLEFDRRRFLSGDPQECADLASEIEDVLLKTATRPYTAGEVRQRLGITNPERLKWTKDGRLKRGADALMQRGQKISLMTYDVKAIDELCQLPEIIDTWRNE